MTFPVGAVRSVSFTMWAYSPTTGDPELVQLGYLLLVLENDGYYRLFCIDDGRLYHIAHDTLEQFSDEPWI